MSDWERLLRLRQGAECPVVLTVYLDDFGGLVLYMDEGDGAKVCGMPLSDDERQKLSEVLQSKEPA